MKEDQTLKMKQGEDREITTKKSKAYKLFEKALENDVNTPQALSIVFDALHLMNTKMDTQKATRNDIKHTRTLLSLLYELFDLRFRTIHIPREVKELVTQREDARKTKNWQRADDLRNKASALGFSIEDTQQGPIIHPTYR